MGEALTWVKQGPERSKREKYLAPAWTKSLVWVEEVPAGTEEAPGWAKAAPVWSVEA